MTKHYPLISLLLVIIMGITQKVNGQNQNNYYLDHDIRESQTLLKYLSEFPSKNTFQLFSHGRAGQLLIDGQWKSAKEISTWLKPKLNSDISHINIYGCEFAKGVTGKHAIMYLEKELGISVSASTNETGNGGDWTLEIGTSIDQINALDYSYSLQLTPKEFNCNGSAYLVSAPTPTDASVLSFVDAQTGEPFVPSIPDLQLTGVNGNPYPYNLNALSYNINDNFIYAINGYDMAGNEDLDATIVKIGSNGVVEELGIPTISTSDTDVILPNWTSSTNTTTLGVLRKAGTIDESDLMYVLGRTNLNTIFLIVVDLLTMTYTDINLNPNDFSSASVPDFAFSPKDGKLYGIIGGFIREIDPMTGIIVNATLSAGSDPVPNTAMGGAWNDDQGNIFFYDNVGGTGTYKFNVLTDTFTRVGNSSVLNIFDATGCFPSYLFKDASPSSLYEPGDTITYQFTIQNSTALEKIGNLYDTLDNNMYWLENSLTPSSPGGGAMVFVGQIFTLENVTVPTSISPPVSFEVKAVIKNNKSLFGQCIDNKATFRAGRYVIYSQTTAGDPNTTVCILNGCDPALSGYADSDGDGVSDVCDLDNDNDGIPDSIEYGVDLSGVDYTMDIDNDGIPDIMDVDQTGGTDANANGIDDSFDAVDNDSDGIPDILDLDSDGDGCPDVLEAGFTDPDGDGILGSSPITVDANGEVLGQGGYTGTTSAVTDPTIAMCHIVATDDINITQVNVAVNGNVLTNDQYDDLNFNISVIQIDSDGDGIVDTTPVAGTPTSILQNGIEVGSLTIEPNTGEYSFVPAMDYTGNVNIRMTICDNYMPPECVMSDLEIEIVPLPDFENNNPPIATNDTNSVAQGDSVTSWILVNDSDIDGDSLSIFSITGIDETGNPVALTTVASNPTNIYDEYNVLAGSAYIDLNTGEVVFNSDVMYMGNVPIDYKITDGKGGLDSATLTITVEPAVALNDTYANDDIGIDLSDIEQTGNVAMNDYDPQLDQTSISTAFTSDGSVLIVDGTTLNTLPSGGKLKLDPVTGDYTYTPAIGFVGTEVIAYTICDNSSPQACDRATLYLTTLSSPIINPIELANFNAVAMNENAQLSWTTLSEESLDDFIIERSLDGFHFEEVNQVSATVNTDDEVNYLFVDKKAIYYGKQIYYRLKQVDHNAEFAYSPVRLVTFDETIKLATIVVPNPVVKGEQVLIQGDGVTSITIYDSMGIVQKEIVFDQAVQSTTISTNQLNSGLYIILINHSKALKLMIQ